MSTHVSTQTSTRVAALSQRYVGRTNGVIIHGPGDWHTLWTRCHLERDNFVPNPATVKEDMEVVTKIVSQTWKKLPSDCIGVDTTQHRVYWRMEGEHAKIIGYGPRSNEQGKLADESEWYGRGRCCALSEQGYRCCNFIDARYSPAVTVEREIAGETRGLCRLHGRIFKREILEHYEDDADHVARWDDQVAVFALEVMSRIHSLSKRKVSDWVFFSDVGQRFCDYMASIGFSTERTAWLDEVSCFNPRTYGVQKSMISWFGTDYIQEEIDCA